MNFSCRKNQRRRQKAYSTNSGFSAIELIIAIQLAFIAISIIYAGYLFGNRMMLRWQEKVAMENHIQMVSQTLTQTVDRLREIEAVQPDLLFGRTAQQSPIRLELRRHCRYNNRIIGDSTIINNQASISYLVAEAQEVVEVDAPEAPFRSIIGVRFMITFEFKNRQYPLRLTLRFNNLSPVIAAK